MTRNQVINTPGFSAELATAIASYLRLHSRTQSGGIDPTVIIRNEGRMNGIHDAADLVQKLTEPEKPDKPERERKLYANDQFTPNNTQNR